MHLLANLCPSQQLEAYLHQIAVLGRHFTQAMSIFAAVPSNGMDIPASYQENYFWQASPNSLSKLQDYFGNLSSEEPTDTSVSSSTFKWFGLSATGWSFGSRKGKPSSWLLLLGQHMQPFILCDQR